MWTQARRPLPSSRPFYGWAVVAVGALVAFSSGPGQSYIFSVFLDSLIEATGLSRTSLSALYAVGTGLSAVMVLVVSRLADRFGVRLVLTGVALAFGAVCFGMAAAVGAVAVFLAFAALRALGQGSMTINATLLVGQWFVRYRGRAMSIVGLGFAASAALLPPIARLLIDTVGWRGAYMALGVMVWVLVIPATLLVVRNRPEEIGLFPDGASAPPAHEGPAAPHAGVKDTRRILTDPRFWLLALPLAIPSFVVTAMVFHQTSIFAERGLSAGIAAAVFVPYAIASASGTALSGYLVDRLGPRNVFRANLGVLFLAVLALLVLRSPVTAVVYAAILGASGGTQSVVSGVIWAHYYGRQGLGRVQGSAMMVLISSAALGPLPLAALFQLTGSYTVGLTTMAGLPLVAAAVVSLLGGRAAPNGGAWIEEAQVKHSGSVPHPSADGVRRP
ncbi:MAG: MFS transporter [Dehalococcoidia bacterium]